MSQPLLRLGIVLQAALFPEARAPCCKLWVDFGPDIGVLACAPPMTKEQGHALIGQLVVASPLTTPEYIAEFAVQAALLTVMDHAGHAMAILPERDGSPGSIIICPLQEDAS